MRYLNPEEAAAHLLNRFTYGPRPGQIDEVVAEGLEVWFERQLEAGIPEAELQPRLAQFKSLDVPEEAFQEAYPLLRSIYEQAIQAGLTTKEEVRQHPKLARKKVLAYKKDHGLNDLFDLKRELFGQHILRAVYSENQLQEVLTEFWFNHFNVNVRNTNVAPYVLSYERDAIRPNVLATFRDLLGATARHPAMLRYLDNARSTAPALTRTTLDDRLELHAGTDRRLAAFARKRQRKKQRFQRKVESMMMDDGMMAVQAATGVNENYARELLELHTLGVDGGYTQHDVIAVARALTGWTFYPARQSTRKQFDQFQPYEDELGVVRDGAFFFRPDWHDAAPKTILGVDFPAGGDVTEGQRVLDLVATHPSTAHHIATKLARRFVSDDPPADLVDEVATTFSETGGDLKAMLRTLVASPAFWSDEARQAKVKPPFHFAMSALRTLAADVRRTGPLTEWLERMGHPPYAYGAPTGYPDEAAAWISAGALLNRMNFSLHLTRGKIPGVKFGRQEDVYAVGMAIGSPDFQRY